MTSSSCVTYKTPLLVLFFFSIFFIPFLAKAQPGGVGRGADFYNQCCCNATRTSCVPLTLDVIRQAQGEGRTLCPTGYEANPIPLAQGQTCSDLQTGTNENIGEIEIRHTISWDNITKGLDFLIPSGCREGEQTKPNDCGIKEALQILGNITSLILGIIGSVALLMFIYAGFMMLISAGNSEKIQKSKTILVNAVIGIIIVFTSWLIINFVIVALTQDKPDFGKDAEIFEKQPIKKSPKIPRQ